MWRQLKYPSLIWILKGRNHFWASLTFRCLTESNLISQYDATFVLWYFQLSMICLKKTNIEFRMFIRSTREIDKQIKTELINESTILWFSINSAHFHKSMCTNIFNTEMLVEISKPEAVSAWCTRKAIPNESMSKVLRHISLGKIFYCDSKGCIYRIRHSRIQAI